MSTEIRKLHLKIVKFQLKFAYEILIENFRLLNGSFDCQRKFFEFEKYNFFEFNLNFYEYVQLKFEEFPLEIRKIFIKDPKRFTSN